ncbi:hypothetical protein ACES2L_03370 [Bdellovibrio bacteriovorus]
MNRGFKLKPLIVLLVLSSLSMACEMKQNLDEMHDATVTMADTTERMEKKTGELDKKSADLDAKTAELYDALRQGNAAILRKEFLEAMSDSQEMPKKLGLAVKYFWSFEFQLWSNQGLDGVERREELAASAAREFIREIHEYASHNDFISPTSSDNKDKNFLALATTLHEVNDKQKNRLKKSEHKLMSMLSLIERALAEGKALKEGALTIDQMTTASRDLLVFEDKLIQILQARHNFILAMLVAKASHVDQDLKAKVLLGLFGTKWSLDLSQYNDIEVAEMKKYLKAVKDTRALLTRNGYKIEADKTIVKIMGNGQVVKSLIKQDSRQKTETELIEMIEAVRADSVELK